MLAADLYDGLKLTEYATLDISGACPFFQVAPWSLLKVQTVEFPPVEYAT